MKNFYRERTRKPYNPLEPFERTALNGKEDFQKWAFGGVHENYTKEEVCTLWNMRHAKRMYARMSESFSDLQCKMYGIFRATTGMK